LSSPHCFAFAVLVVIPEGDLLLFVPFALFILILRPKIACQALQSPNRFRINNIQMKKSSTPTAIIETEREKAESPGPKGLGFLL
jgi:hypothetical protein